MSNDRHTDPDDHAGLEDDGATIFQIRNQLFQHQMTLRRHGHNLPSLQDQLALMVVKTMSSVFFLSAVAAGLAVFLGVYTPSEAFAYVESVALYFAILAGLLIGLLNSIQWAIDWVESAKKIREGPPEIPDELRSKFNLDQDQSEKD